MGGRALVQGASGTASRRSLREEALRPAAVVLVGDVARSSQVQVDDDFAALAEASSLSKAELLPLCRLVEETGVSLGWLRRVRLRAPAEELVVHPGRKDLTWA